LHDDTPVFLSCGLVRLDQALAAAGRAGRRLNKKTSVGIDTAGAPGLWPYDTAKLRLATPEAAAFGKSTH